MKKTIALAMAGLTIGLGVMSVKADDRSWEWSPLGIGIAAPIQLPFMESDVYGLRIGGFCGYNYDVYGIDAGIVEVAEHNFGGIQASAFSWTEGNAYGLTVAPLATVIGGDSVALQAAFANVVWSDGAGIQLGVINRDNAFAGIQFAGIINWNEMGSAGFEVSPINDNQAEFDGLAIGALINHTATMRGCQIGLFNTAYQATGYQLGIFNACDTMHGVQFGLVNIIADSKLPFMLIANASF